jgi:ADP-ribosylglycohydrolase/protein-tyrosine phosphatase
MKRNDIMPGAALPPPIPNSYWVEPGRLLGGEYPGSMSSAEAMERVEALLRAGVTSFVDLTEAGELPDYDALLGEATEQHVRYRRFPILDHGVPESPAHMRRILDHVQAELDAGHCVYVHCHAGIGRTGMAMGCHLIRGGLTADAALDQLQLLWRQSARSRRWARVPETDAQVAFVRAWSEASTRVSGEAVVEARGEAAMLGLALGDALGSLVSSSNFDTSTVVTQLRDRGALRTGANTAMTRAVGESLVAHGAHDPSDQMQRYLDWTRSGEDVVVPPELKRALAAWQWSRKPNAGSHDPKHLDPHTLPRSLAVALFASSDPAEAIELAASVSRTTLQSPVVLDLCRFWTALFIDALNGRPRAELLSLGGPAVKLLRARSLKPQVQRLLDNRPETEPGSATDALSVSRVALAAFASATTLRDALMRTEAASRAMPVAAAICGALVGAHYGIDAIPTEWRKQLPEDAALRSLARHLSG